MIIEIKYVYYDSPLEKYPAYAIGYIDLINVRILNQ